MSEFDEAKKLLESTGHLVVEKREKKTFDTFMTYLMNQNGKCSADGGDHTFYCLKLNDENFSFEAYQEFKKQIEAEGLYDWSWVAGLIPNRDLKDGKVPVSWLPIFGRRDKYETKWLQNGSPSSAVAQVFRDRSMKVKDRIDYFAIPVEEQLSLNTLKEELEKIGLPCRIRNNYRKGDFLETNLEFTPEQCKKWNDIPVSGGYKIVWLIRNKYIINKHKFNSVEKVVDYFKKKKELYEIAEAKAVIEKAGKKLIKESTPDYHPDKAMKITQLIDDTFDEIRYDDARDIGEYFADRVVSYDMTDPEDIEGKLWHLLSDNGIRAHYDLTMRLANQILDIAGL